MRTPPRRSRSSGRRIAARLAGAALAASLALTVAPAQSFAAGDAPIAGPDGTLTVDNSTGLASDGTPMGGPGLDNTDVDGYYYSIGEAQIDSSAGGNNLYLYRGKSWNNKEQVAKVAGPETPFVHPDGTRSYPLANSKLERIDFERSQTGKYVIWAHWELLHSYAASQTIVLQADKPEGPYTIVTDHARPGASFQVGSKGQAGTTDFEEAMGDRVGRLRADHDTANAEGEYGSVDVPVTGREYPHQVQSFELPKGPRTDKYDLDKPNRIKNDMYGTSEAGNWWTYNFNDLRDDMTLKAVAVGMTSYDQSAYDAAKEAGVSPSASKYIVRYPAAKSDRTKAAGISAEGYDGNADEAYDPNPDDTTEPIVDEIAKSAVATEQYKAVEDDSGARKELKTPLISPRVDENQGVNADKTAVVADEGDRFYVTADIDLDTSKVMVTTDGTDPRTSETAWQWDNRWDVPNMAISNGLQVKAVATNSDATEFSEVASTTFEVAAVGSQEAADVPVFQPVMNFKGGDWKRPYSGGMFGYKELRILSPTYNAEVFYAMDGADPAPPRYGQNIGFGSRDYALYTDPKEFGGDGKSYLITGQDHVYMRVWELNEDLTNVVPEKEYDINVRQRREAPQAIRGPGGEYVYLLTSGQSGWYKNQAMYQRTEDLSQGFAKERDEHGYRSGEDDWTPLQPFSDNTTYNSQVGGVWNLGTKDKPVYLFNGSRWVVNDLENSTTTWLPLTIDDEAMGTGSATGETVEIGTDRNGEKVTAPAYEPQPGRVTVKYAQKVDINLDQGTVKPSNDYDERVQIATDEANLGDTDPDNHTPRVIDFQPIGDFYECDKFDPQGEAGETEWVTCPGGELEKQGIEHRRDVGQAFDGVDWDIDNYDGTEKAYRGLNSDFFITVDLGQPRDLTNVSMSFKSVSGSDNAHRYAIQASNDNENWTTIVNNNQNNFPGFQAHDLTGNTYRYLKLQNNESYDMAHNKSADWARGLYEMTIRAEKAVARDVSKLEPAIEQATVLSEMTDTFTEESLAALNEKLAPASELLDALKREGEDTQHTQEEVDKAATELITAIKGLKGVGAEVKADITKLAEAIDNGETRLEDANEYTRKSVRTLQRAVTDGKRVLAAADDPATTQAKVDAATDAITDAIDNLERRQASAPEIDASVLRNAVDEASKAKAETYTTRSWTPFTEALAAAEGIASAPQTQQQVEGALDDLNAAAELLTGT